MNEPLVSFCIPTYKRERYLASLLESLVGQLAEFPYAYEIVIADNASPDATPKVVERFREALPIRYFRHPENIGGFPNWQFVMSQAQGRYVVYIADDDSVLGDQVAQTIAKMEADPELVVVYAPWMLYDLVAQKNEGQFYSVPGDLRVARGQHRELLDHVLRYQIFPEVQITRRETLQRLMPRINEHAFFAFVHAADYLAQGAVLIQQHPYYVAITRYFADETRDQLGNEEVEYAWDRYRGGLEYMAARAGAQIGPEERAGLHARMQYMIAVRMSVAIRLRHQSRKNPVDTYMIAMRLRGLGYERLSPVPLKQLASEAMMHFLLNDPELHRGVRQMVCVGNFGANVENFLREHASHPVEFLKEAPPQDRLSDCLVLLNDEAAASLRNDPQRGVRVIRQDHLLERFGL